MLCVATLNHHELWAKSDSIVIKEIMTSHVKSVTEFDKGLTKSDIIKLFQNALNAIQIAPHTHEPVG